MLKSLISIPLVSKLFNFAKDEITTITTDKNIEIINQTIQSELKTESMFVKCWRPFFGYCISITWLMYMSIICYTALSNKPNAELIILSMSETLSLWSMALGVLGVSVVKRSTDKRLINLISNKKKEK